MTKETAATPKLTVTISVNIGLNLVDLTTETKKVKTAMMSKASDMLHINAIYGELTKKKGNTSIVTVMI